MIYRGRTLLMVMGFLPLFSSAQNLVPNPGFEMHATCIDPLPNESLQNCDEWFNAVEPLATVDWYATCYPSGSFYLLPNLFYGSSFPQSGNAMVGFGPYSSITDIGECMGVRLTQPLQKDSAYCFGFWLKNSHNHNAVYSMHSFDVAFINDTTGINERTDVTSYTKLPNSIDNGEWNYLSSYYVANGGEQYMLIGVFDAVPDYYTQHPQSTPENRMYYYLDDVNVNPCSKDSIFQVVLELPNVITSNGDHVNDSYEIRHHNIKTMQVAVLNRWGVVVQEYDGLTYTWDGTDRSGTLVSDGVYFVKVVAESNFGEVFTKSQFVHVGN